MKVFDLFHGFLHAMRHARFLHVWGSAASKCSTLILFNGAWWHRYKYMKRLHVPSQTDCSQVSDLWISYMLMVVCTSIHAGMVWKLMSLKTSASFKHGMNEQASFNQALIDCQARPWFSAMATKYNASPIHATDQCAKAVIWKTGTT